MSVMSVMLGVVSVIRYVRYTCMAYPDTGYTYNGYDVFRYFRYNKKIIKNFFFYRQAILSESASTPGINEIKLISLASHYHLITDFFQITFFLLLLFTLSILFLMR